MICVPDRAATIAVCAAARQREKSFVIRTTYLSPLKQYLRATSPFSSCCYCLSAARTWKLWYAVGRVAVITPSTHHTATAPASRLSHLWNALSFARQTTQTPHSHVAAGLPRLIAPAKPRVRDSLQRSQELEQLFPRNRDCQSHDAIRSEKPVTRDTFPACGLARTWRSLFIHLISTPSLFGQSLHTTASLSPLTPTQAEAAINITNVALSTKKEWQKEKSCPCLTNPSSPRKNTT